jgi:hypothetical protein
MNEFDPGAFPVVTLSQHLGRVEGKIDALLVQTATMQSDLAGVQKQVWWGRGAAVAVLMIYFPKLRDFASAIGLG